MAPAHSYRQCHDPWRTCPRFTKAYIGSAMPHSRCITKEMSGAGEDSDELLAAIECAANPTRHRILEMLIETSGLGAKALADKMGFTRQHISYHISELRKVGLIKDMPAGTTVIFHVSQLGRTTLQRIHSVSPSEARDRKSVV